MSAKAVWGIVFIVLSVCLIIFSGFKIWQVFDAESQMNAAKGIFGAGVENMYKALGVDVAAELSKTKTIYFVVLLASIAGAVLGTKLLQKPTV